MPKMNNYFTCAINDSNSCSLKWFNDSDFSELGPGRSTSFIVLFPSYKIILKTCDRRECNIIQSIIGSITEFWHTVIKSDISTFIKK